MAEQIQSYLDEGESLESIENYFHKALEQKKKEETRNEYMDQLFRALDNWVNKDEGDAFDVAARLATWYVGDTHGNWSTDRLREFCNNAYEQLRTLVYLYEIGDKGESMVQALNGLSFYSNSSKSKSKENSDEDTLQDFVRRL